MESAVICATAVTPSGNINPATPCGSVLTKCGFTSLAAVQAPDVTRDSFVETVRNCLDQTQSALAATISNTGLAHFYDIVPHVAAACVDRAKKKP